MFSELIISAIAALLLRFVAWLNCIALENAFLLHSDNTRRAPPSDLPFWMCVHISNPDWFRFSLRTLYNWYLHPLDRAASALPCLVYSFIVLQHIYFCQHFFQCLYLSLRSLDFYLNDFSILPLAYPFIDVSTNLFAFAPFPFLCFLIGRNHCSNFLLERLIEKQVPVTSNIPLSQIHNSKVKPFIILSFI